jgi:prepilin-type N-terminal cleavage/methylation domain-containing protein
MKRLLRKMSQKGVTLVEILIILAIISILVAVIATNI